MFINQPTEDAEPNKQGLFDDYKQNPKNPLLNPRNRTSP